MKYASVCSGIEAATVAWESLGWEPAFFSEISPFPSAVLKQRWPKVSNLGDITKIKGKPNEVDLLVGGTPCTGFSLVGRREGLDDERSAIAFAYCRLLAEMQPQWFVWENVPDALNINHGNDFRRILLAFQECGYTCTWRVLDCQYVRVDEFNRGIPQQRRRVFVVGHLGTDWRPSAAVLLEPASSYRPTRDKTKPCTIGFTPSDAGRDSVYDISPTLRSGGKGGTVYPAVYYDGIFRYLTPIECERLMGFPDNYTRIPWRGNIPLDCPIGHRYRALGNSMPVNSMRLIGKRIDYIIKELA